MYNLFVTELPWSALPLTTTAVEETTASLDFSVSHALEDNFRDSLFIEIVNTRLTAINIKFRQVYNTGDDGIYSDDVSFPPGVPTLVEVFPKLEATGFNALYMYSAGYDWNGCIITDLYVVSNHSFWTNFNGQREV